MPDNNDDNKTALDALINFFRTDFSSDLSLEGSEEIIKSVYTEAAAGAFGSQSSRLGKPWPPRKDTLPHPLLIKTGKMLNAALNPQVTITDKNTAVIKYQGEHAGLIGIHNEGTKFIPPRPSAGVLNDKDTDLITENIFNRFTTGFANRLSKLKTK